MLAEQLADVLSHPFEVLEVRGYHSRKGVGFFHVEDCDCDGSSNVLENFHIVLGSALAPVYLRLGIRDHVLRKKFSRLDVFRFRQWLNFLSENVVGFHRVRVDEVARLMNAHSPRAFSAQSVALVFAIHHPRIEAALVVLEANRVHRNEFGEQHRLDLLVHGEVISENETPSLRSVCVEVDITFDRANLGLLHYRLLRSKHCWLEALSRLAVKSVQILVPNVVPPVSSRHAIGVDERNDLEDESFSEFLPLQILWVCDHVDESIQHVGRWNFARMNPSRQEDRWLFEFEGSHL